MSGASGESTTADTVEAEPQEAYCDADRGGTVARLVAGGLGPWMPGDAAAGPSVSDDPADEIKNRYLSEVDIFRDCTESEIHRIGEQAPMRHFQRGEILYSPNQAVETLFILKAGSVRVFRIGPDGRAMTTAMVGPGTVFGEMVLLGQHMYDQYAATMEDATICLMNRVDVYTYLLSNPKIAMRVAELLGERLVEAERRLTDMALKAAPERIASTLHTLARKEFRKGAAGRQLVVAITHEQLADLVGTSRETVTKALGSLAETGVIKLGRGKITVLKPLALKDAAGG